MRRDNLADPRQALEPGYTLSQFRILLAEVPNLFLRRGCRVEVKMQRAHQLVQLKAHTFRAGQREQVIEDLLRPRLLFPLVCGKRYAFIEQQGLDATFGGGQLLRNATMKVARESRSRLRD